MNKLKALTIFITAISLSSCGDFVDTPEQAVPPETSEAAPNGSPPATKPDPTSEPKPATENQNDKHWRACEAERLWAYNARLIDVGALRIFQQRNLAPVFNDPGVRQSGIIGWYACLKALEANGFLD